MTVNTRLLIIGGSDAGISAALRARELNKKIKITIVMADSYPNFSICGLPYALSGEVSDWHNLSHRKIDDLKEYDIEFYFDTFVTEILPEEHLVRSNTETFTYEQLIVGTGMKTKELPIVGDVDKVGYLTSMEGFFQIEKQLSKPEIKKIAVIGGGYVGIESAEALVKKGFEVTLITKSNQVLSTIDEDLSVNVYEKLVENSINVVLNSNIEEIKTADYDFILSAVGITPNSQLLIDAGANFNRENNAIKVDDQMHTNLKDIFAAGDLVETKHLLLSNAYIPLGTTSHKQGRIAGANAVGKDTSFAGIIGTQVIRVFDLIIARTGLNLTEAKNNNFNPTQITVEVDDHKAYIPGSKKITIRIIADIETKKILGAQLIGSDTSEIAKRTDIFSTAIYNEMTVDSFLNLDLTYSPVVGSPWDAVQMAMQKMQLKIENNEN